MQSEIYINLLKTDGEVRKSLYDTRESDTAKPVKIPLPKQDDQNRTTIQKNEMKYNGGLTTLSGSYFTDYICLWQLDEQQYRTMDSG